MIAADAFVSSACVHKACEPVGRSACRKPLAADALVSAACEVRGSVSAAESIVGCSVRSGPLPVNANGSGVYPEHPRLEMFKRDWNFQARLVFSSAIENFNRNCRRENPIEETNRRENNNQ